MAYQFIVQGCAKNFNPLFASLATISFGAGLWHGHSTYYDWRNEEIEHQKTTKASLVHKIDELKKKHVEELQDLKNFYEPPPPAPKGDALIDPNVDPVGAFFQFLSKQNAQPVTH